MKKLMFIVGAGSEFSYTHTGDVIGYGYLNYYEEKEKSISFPRFNFKLYIGEN